MAKAKPLFMDSFHYEAADILKKWTGTTTSPASTFTIGTGVSRVLGQRGAYTTGSSGGSFRGYYKQLPSTYDTVVWGSWYYSAATITASYGVSGMSNTTTAICGVMGDGAGHLGFCRAGATLVGSYSAGTISAGWNWIEVKAYIHPSAGSYEIRANGTTMVSGSSLNTGTGAASSFSIYYQNQVSGHCDVFVADASGGTYTDFLGPQLVVPMVPTTNGNYTAWTPNFGTNAANVSGLIPDADQSFNYASSANSKDSFAHTPLPGTGSVNGIQHNILARTDGSSHTLRPLMRISGSDYTGTSQNVGSSYGYLTEVTHLSPATSAAWTYSEVNGMEIGYELAS
jgi:hypothetical protein